MNYDEPKYEPKDLDANRVMQFAVWLVVLLIVACIASAIYFFWLGQRERALVGPITGPLQADMPPYPPPAIQLQPGKDLQAIRRREHELLSQYRWVDRAQGIVAIPIEVAILRIAKKGLPVAGEPGVENGPTWLEMLQERGKEGP